MIPMTVLVAAMVVACLLCIAVRRSPAVKIVTPACILVLLVLAVGACMPAIERGVVDDGVFYMDGLSAVFMLLVAFVGLMASIYSGAYITADLEEGEITHREHSHYYPLLIVFVSVMMLTFSVRSMAVVWLGVGATTLVSTFLVGFYSREESTEAAWKYIILCSVGITIALFGLTLTYAAAVGVVDSGEALDWPVLMAYAAELDPVMMKMAMVLVIVGFGTKVGFVPMHTWLPDAHSRAPSPVSGLLSAVLLNCAMYGILRMYGVSEIVNPGFASTLMLAFGFLSLGTAAFFIVSARDMKRMLAYSSIENMGLIAIGIGIGTPAAIFAAMVQLVAHSITKPILFFSAGDIIQAYGTRTMSEIRGVSKALPFTGAMMAAGTLAIVGCPPFLVFAGELGLLMGALDSGMAWAAALMAVLLAIVFAGFVRNVFPMLTGEPGKDVELGHRASRCLPVAILFAATLLLGLFMPDAVADWLRDAAGCILGVSS